VLSFGGCMGAHVTPGPENRLPRRVSRRSCHRLGLIGVTTAGDASRFGAAVLWASNCAAQEHHAAAAA
jgi:hypothetical protein